MSNHRHPLRSFVGRCLRRLPPRLQCLVIRLRIGGRLEQGRGSFVHSSVHILGKNSVAIGANSVLSQDCWLNVNHSEAGKKAIVIGANCFIGRRNFFSSGHTIDLHDYVLTTNDCHFLGSTHVASDPMRPIITTGTTAEDSIVIGANTFIGAGARIVGNVSIGHGCIVAAGSTVTHDVPPFSKVLGSPAVVRRRYSVPRQDWVATSDFTLEDEAALPDETAYLRRLAAHGPIAMPYLAAARDLGNC